MGHVKVELWICNLSEEDYLRTFSVFLQNEVFYWSLFDPSLEIKHVSSQIFNPLRLAVAIYGYLIPVLRTFIKSIERNLILIHSHLRKVTVVFYIRFFYIDEELPRSSHLKDIAGIDDSRQQLSRNLTLLLSVRGVETWSKDIQHVSQNIRFHFSHIVLRFLLKISFAAGDDECRGRFGWSFLGVHQEMTILGKMKLKFRPNRIETTLVPYQLHTKFDAWADTLQKLSFQRFIGVITEVLWPHYASFFNITINIDNVGIVRVMLEDFP